MKHTSLIILFFIIPALNCFSQKYSVDSLFNEFKRDIEIEQELHNGKVVWDDETRITYYLLILNAPVDSLIKYTNDSNPAIRSQAFVGLVYKCENDQILNDILNLHIDDTAKFTSCPTDVVIGWSVNEHMQLMVKNKTKVRENDYQARIDYIENSSLKLIIPGLDHGLIDKEVLLSLNEIKCSNDDSKILSFSLSTKRKSVDSKSNAVTKKMRRIIRKENAGDIVFIDNIRVEFPDKTTRKLSPIVLKLK